MFPLLPSTPRTLTLTPHSRPTLSGGAVVVADSPQRLLIVALDGLREVVFTSALTPLLRARHPNAEITVWCGSSTAQIAALLPAVDRVEAAEPCWEDSTRRPRGSVAAFARSIARLRRHAMDVAILSSAPARTAIAATLTGAASRVGHASTRGTRWLTEPLAPADDTKPALQEMARLLEPVGVVLPRTLHCQLNTEPLTHRIEHLRPLLGPRPVVLQPFAGAREHAVPLKHWIRVAVELSRRGFDPLWIGSARRLREVHRAVGSSVWKYMDRLGDATLADTAAAITLSRLFVGHDSGMLHMAAALGIPVAGVFTPGDPGRAYPQGTGESRLLLRRSPDGVTSDQILDVVDDLPLRPTLHLVR